MLEPTATHDTNGHATSLGPHSSRHISKCFAQAAAPGFRRCFLQNTLLVVCTYPFGIPCGFQLVPFVDRQSSLGALSTLAIVAYLIWLWVQKRYPEWNLVNGNMDVNLRFHWWFNLDPYPYYMLFLVWWVRFGPFVWWPVCTKNKSPCACPRLGTPRAAVLRGAAASGVRHPTWLAALGGKINIYIHMFFGWLSAGELACPTCKLQQIRPGNSAGPIVL